MDATRVQSTRGITTLSALVRAIFPLAVLCTRVACNSCCPRGRWIWIDWGCSQVKRAFEYAYTVLTNAVLPLSSHSVCQEHSILGRIIRVTDKVIQYRRWIDNTFGHRYSSPTIPRTRPPRSLSSSGSTSSVEESGGSSEVSGWVALIYLLLITSCSSE